MKLEHDSKVAGHFRRDRTLELISKNWYWPKMEHDIGKKHFCHGRMAESEWTHSIRAVRDNPVAAYSAPDVNTTHPVAYHPPIAVSPFLLALLIPILEQTL